jgi:hypothetical protein
MAAPKHASGSGHSPAAKQSRSDAGRKQQADPDSASARAAEARWLSLQRAAGNSAVSGYLAVQRAPKNQTIDFSEGLTLTGGKGKNLGPGVTAAAFIQNQVNLIKESFGLYWDNYRDGLLNFQTSMSFSSEQEAESHYLTSTLKALVKVDLDLFLEGLGTGCEELEIPIKLAKAAIEAGYEEYERVEKAENEVKIAEFIERTRNAIGPAKERNLTAWNDQVLGMQNKYLDGARGEYPGQSDDEAMASPPIGEAASLLDNLEQVQKGLRAQVVAMTAATFQERITADFAATGSSYVGPITAGLQLNGHMYLNCRVYRDEDGKYSVKSMSPSWDLKTNAPNPERAAGSLDSSLKAQGKEPIDSTLPKIVEMDLERESGHWYSENDIDSTSYHFTSPEEMSWDGSDAVLHGNDPAEFKEAWDAVVRAAAAGVTKLTGSGP